MSVRTGTGGSVVFAGTSGAVLDGFQISRWTSTFTKDSNDITPFQVANNHRDSQSGNGVLTGTFEGSLDGTTPLDTTDLTAESAAAALITLGINRENSTGDAGTIQKQSFQGFLSGVSVEVGVGVTNKVTGSFTSTGAITTEINS
ncbi:MAG: hypothetical protein O7D91_17800 [Planctomycetota bacterium]|nr:hypothetical protein [Planctomycetota bacterium]